MPKPVTKLRSMLNRLRDSLFKGLFRARFRYDVFISYNHQAKGYAVVSFEGGQLLPRADVP
jgi:hypothetical protein